MQNYREADLAAEMLGVADNGPKRPGRHLEQNAVERA